MSKPTVKQPVVTDELIAALETVLERLWRDELIAYRQRDEEPQSDGGDHFFLQLEVIRHWLDYVEEDCHRG